MLPRMSMLGLIISACVHQPAALSPAPEVRPVPSPSGHCPTEEVVLFSCELTSGETASLCASADLGTAPGLGTVQFRMGPQGAPDQIYPQQPKHPEFFPYERERTARSDTETVNFRSSRFNYLLRYSIGSSHAGEAAANNYQGVQVRSLHSKDKRELLCAQPATSDMARLSSFKLRDKPPALGLTSIELGEQVPAVVVYDGPAGTRLGVLEADDGENPHAIVRPLQVRQDDGKILVIPSMQGTRETSYEVHSLDYFAHQDGFSQVLPHAGPKSLWVRDTDMGKPGPQPWASYLAGLGGVLWRDNLEGLQIHRSPDADARSKTLPAGVYELSTTGRHRGLWLEIEVTGYTDDFLCGGTGKPSGKRWKGWIRGSTPEGEPSIWHYTRGC
jgi:hypothetical protein